MAVNKDAIGARLAAKMEAIVAERRAARIADAEREMQLRNQFADFWQTVELLNQHGLEQLNGRVQFDGEGWDPPTGVISGKLDLQGPGGTQQLAYRVRGDTLQIDWPDKAGASYTTASLPEAIDRLTDLAAATFAKPE